MKDNNQEWCNAVIQHLSVCSTAPGLATQSQRTPSMPRRQSKSAKHVPNSSKIICLTYDDKNIIISVEDNDITIRYTDDSHFIPQVMRRCRLKDALELWVLNKGFSDLTIKEFLDKMTK